MIIPYYVYLSYTDTYSEFMKDSFISFCFVFLRASEQFVGCFLHCFDSVNPDIVTSALKNLPEFCVLCQGNYFHILVCKPI